MDRKRIVVALAIGAALFAWTSSGFGQISAPPGGSHVRGERGLRPARERWRQMSPEDRQRIRSNAERWLRMAPEERRALRDAENLRRERIRREAEAAIEQSGLQLQAEKREMYERRYLQERRRIERDLRQELNERRQRELAPVMEDLKKEFGEGQRAGTCSSSAAPSSPSPGR